MKFAATRWSARSTSSRVSYVVLAVAICVYAIESIGTTSAEEPPVVRPQPAKTGDEKAAEPSVEERLARQLAEFQTRRESFVSGQDTAVYRTVTLEELEEDYRSRRAAIDSEYHGKVLRIRATEVQMGLNLSRTPAIALTGSGEDFEVKCFFDSDPGLEKLVEENRPIEVRGLYVKSVLPVLIHCSLGDEKKPASAPKTGTRKTQRPELTLTAEELEATLKSSLEEATSKFVGKRLRVTGQVSRMKYEMLGDIVFRLESPLATQFYLQPGLPWYCCRPGQTVTLVGLWNPFYPSVLNCEIAEVTGSADPTYSTEELAKNLEANAEQFRDKFYLRQLVVEGEVVNIDRDSDELASRENVITLRGTDGTSVLCEMDPGELAAVDSLRIGNRVTITGWNTKESPTDSIILAQCLFWRGE